MCMYGHTWYTRHTFLCLIYQRWRRLPMAVIVISVFGNMWQCCSYSFLLLTKYNTGYSINVFLHQCYYYMVTWTTKLYSKRFTATVGSTDLNDSTRKSNKLIFAQRFLNSHMPCPCANEINILFRPIIQFCLITHKWFGIFNSWIIRTESYSSLIRSDSVFTSDIVLQFKLLFNLNCQFLTSGLYCIGAVTPS